MAEETEDVTSRRSKRMLEKFPLKRTTAIFWSDIDMVYPMNLE